MGWSSPFRRSGVDSHDGSCRFNHGVTRGIRQAQPELDWVRQQIPNTCTVSETGNDEENFKLLAKLLR